MAVETKANPRESYYLWSKEADDLLSGLFLAAVDKATQLVELSSSSAVPLGDAVIPVPVDLSVSNQTSCSTCGAEFTNVIDQRSHFKSDWHRYNLKQKIKGLPPFSEDHFEYISGDISSISGTGSSCESSCDEEATADRNKGKSETKQKGINNAPSDSDEESFHVEGAGRRHPRVFYRNDSGELLSIFRCVIHCKKNKPDTADQLIGLTKNLLQKQKWAVFMTAGGHFAGALFDGKDVIAHKTFHRYVVRAKRGTAQSSRDKQGNAPKSGGASLRRYNEAALTQEIQELIGTVWAEDIKNCSQIFLRAPSFNRQIFFSGKSAPLDKSDPRIRIIPFQTRRPTYREIIRVHELMAEIKVHDKYASIQDFIQPSVNKTSIRKATHTFTLGREPAEVIPSKYESSSSSSDEETELLMETLTIDSTQLAMFECTHKPRRRARKAKSKNKPADTETENLVQDKLAEIVAELRNELYTACKVGDRDKVQECLNSMHEKYMDSEGISESSNLLGSTGNFLSASFGEKPTTLLHVACRAGSHMVITPLLESGADPCVKDCLGQYPYVISANKETRNEFRRCMANHPEKYDYVGAQIPGPLTVEMESEKRAKEAEKKKAQRKARKERQKEQKLVDADQREEEQEKQRYLKLSDREKRALAAERRLAAQKASTGEDCPVMIRCWQCADDITGKVPFEYYDYKFCSPKCLKEHKLSNR